MKLVSFLAGMLSFFMAIATAGNRSLTSCESRSNVDPGRLNIAVEADHYGIIPPCKANMNFYISRNTRLRSIEGMIQLSRPDSSVLSTEAVRIDLVRTSYGMFAAGVSLDPAIDTTCRSLSVSLEIKSCRGGGGEIIECPEIRVKSPLMFDGLSVSGENLKICHDD